MRRSGHTEPPMKVDSRRLVRNLNADQLDFRHANELIRATFAATSNAPNANGNAVAVDIEAPKPGFLIMAGSVDAIGSANDPWDCRLTVNGATVIGTIRNVRVNSEGGDHTRNDEEDCAGVNATEVTPPASKPGATILSAFSRV